jgi:hypothetical protein
MKIAFCDWHVVRHVTEGRLAHSLGRAFFLSTADIIIDLIPTSTISHQVPVA